MSFTARRDLCILLQLNNHWRFIVRGREGGGSQMFKNGICFVFMSSDTWEKSGCDWSSFHHRLCFIMQRHTETVQRRRPCWKEITVSFTDGWEDTVRVNTWEESKVIRDTGENRLQRLFVFFFILSENDSSNRLNLKNLNHFSPFQWIKREKYTRLI